MADAGVANGVLLAGLILLPIAGGCLFFRAMSSGCGSAGPGREGRTDGICARHHRHVAGRVARRKADARRPPGHYPRFGLDVMPEPRRRQYD